MIFVTQMMTNNQRPDFGIEAEWKERERERRKKKKKELQTIEFINQVFIAALPDE